MFKPSASTTLHQVKGLIVPNCCWHLQDLYFSQYRTNDSPKGGSCSIHAIKLFNAPLHRDIFPLQLYVILFTLHLWSTEFILATAVWKAIANQLLQKPS